MSQSSTYNQRTSKWQKKPLITYDCPICVTTNTRQLLELPCGHNLCLSCLHMICAHSTLACPFCRCRLSTWLRRNPDYSKLTIKRQSTTKTKKKRIIQQQPQPQPSRHHQTSKIKPTFDEQGNISDDWLLAKRIHYEELEEFRYTYGRVTRSMAKKMKT
ncbi:unnamed protein product [Rotaria sordida]|uniref:RING-type domain-containing protein n=1 Tax=Rotaria sordida TaxID=392033 RepID=A0A815BJ48_9BILA|nr:unnamed protein product [Rotaria sordida]CAF4066425.1 unnamed protein product [Rotaria sordida]